MPSLLEVLCDVHDFCLAFLPGWRQQLIAHGQQRRQRARPLSLSEIMTILIAFHHSQYRTCKAFTTTQVLRHWQAEFPGLVSYSRFVEFIPSPLGPLCAYLRPCDGTGTGISFVDATALADAPLAELRAALGVSGSLTTVWRAVRHLGLTVNKSPARRRTRPP